MTSMKEKVELSLFADSSLKNGVFNRKHAWVTVVNPLNSQLLLQACDNCGVVKSENSVVRACKASQNREIISSVMNARDDVAV